MEVFKKYKRIQLAELRPVNKTDIIDYEDLEQVIKGDFSDEYVKLSVSEFDLKNGSPKIGDMIARNPNNHNDQWLVAEEYFKNNFEEIEK